MSHHQHSAVSTDAEGKKHLTVLQSLDSATVRKLHHEYVMPATFHYYPESLVLQRGEGMFLTDADGVKYLDFFGGILTVSLGHCHPEVVGAVREQLGILGHTSTLYQNEWIVRLARELAALTPGNLQQSFFTNSGSEADEMAILLAKLFTGRSEIIALRHSYSGRGMYAISAMGHGAWRPIAPVMPGISLMPAPYCYRCPFGLSYPSCDIRCADDVKEVIATTTTGQPAAFIAEPILGVGGFITPPKEYFQKVLEPIRKTGALFICDEVQTGFGRTGTYWNGIEHYGVQPDIMTFAKGIASGMPMGATITTKEIASAFRGLTISTYGGNPVSSVAALATIHVMTRENIPERAARLGNRLRQGLLSLQEKYPLIGDVRGMGLMQGIELVEDRKTKEPASKRANLIIEVLRKRQLLIGKGGLYGNTLRIAPPMLVTESQIDEALAHLDAGLHQVSAS